MPPAGYRASLRTPIGRTARTTRASSGIDDELVLATRHIYAQIHPAIELRFQDSDVSSLASHGWAYPCRNGESVAQSDIRSNAIIGGAVKTQPGINFSCRPYGAG